MLMACLPWEKCRVEEMSISISKTAAFECNSRVFERRTKAAGARGDARPAFFSTFKKALSPWMSRLSE
jgi:hypothetical protein